MRAPAYTVVMRRLMRTLLILICAVCLLFGLLLAGIDLYGHVRQSEHADIICLFGAAVWGNTPSPELEARIMWAVQLYHEGRASVMFLSGGPTGSSLSEGDVMSAVAVAHGVPRSAIIVDNAGTTTASTLTNLGRYMKGNGLRTSLMVSSPFHMARIMILAHLKGLTAFTDPPRETPITLNSQQNLRSVVREALALVKDLMIVAISPD